jgi:dTMP kinase
MKNNPYSGKFVVLEGLDGSGQSTQVKFLGDFLKEKGQAVVLTKEPTLSSQAGQKIRKVLDEKIKIEPAQLQKLFAQDRKEHLKNLIEPALKQEKIVISDRYFFSSFAFGALDLDLEWLIKLNNDFILPDMTFFLDVKPEICLARIEKRGEEIKLFEKKEKLAKVWQNYKLILNRFENTYIINGEKSIEEVFKQIKEKVINKLNL